MLWSRLGWLPGRLLLAPVGLASLKTAGAGWAEAPGDCCWLRLVLASLKTAGAGWAGAPGGFCVQHSSPSRKTKPALEK